MQRPAITLIELLIVAIIIGILTMVAIPHFGGARSAALHAHAQNSIAHIAHAAKIWNAEFGTSNTDYPNVNDGGFEAALGTDVTGIDLGPIDADGVWDYALSSATTRITATFKTGNSTACTNNKSFSYNLTTSHFSAFDCK